VTEAISRGPPDAGVVRSGVLDAGGPPVMVGSTSEPTRPTKKASTAASATSSAIPSHTGPRAPVRGSGAAGVTGGALGPVRGGGTWWMAGGGPLASGAAGSTPRAMVASSSSTKDGGVSAASASTASSRATSAAERNGVA
jgi:hypothetical protein